MNRLRDLREDNDLKQEDVGKRIGVSRQSVSQYELGQRSLTPELINKFCDLYGVTADYLLGRSPLMRMELTPEEESLILAHRRADDRAKDMVRLALDPYWEDVSSETETESA